MKNSLLVLAFIFGPTMSFAQASARQLGTLESQKKMSMARQITQASPNSSPSVLNQEKELGFAVLILEIFLSPKGHATKVEVIRWPINPAARYTINLAVAAIQRASPYNGLTDGVNGTSVTQTFIFNQNREFYLDALNNN